MKKSIPKHHYLFAVIGGLLFALLFIYIVEVLIFLTVLILLVMVLKLLWIGTQTIIGIILNILFP